MAKVTIKDVRRTLPNALLEVYGESAIAAFEESPRYRELLHAMASRLRLGEDFEDVFDQLRGSFGQALSQPDPAAFLAAAIRLLPPEAQLP